MADYGDPEWDDDIEECKVHLYTHLPCDKCRITELETCINEIALQKTTDELVADGQYKDADFESAYEQMILMAREQESRDE